MSRFFGALAVLAFACIAGADAPSGATGRLVLAPKRGVGTGPATYTVFVAGTRTSVAQGRVIESLQGKPKVLDLPPGEYEVELASSDVIGQSPVVLGPVRVGPNATTELPYRFSAGTLKVDAVRSATPIVTKVRLYDSTGNRVAEGATDECPSYRPAQWFLTPGRYRVVSDVSSGGERSVEIGVGDGETTELLLASDRAFSVVVEHGEVVVLPGEGPRVVLAEAGPHRSPAISPDGSLIAFVRGTPETLVQAAIEEGEATELWVSGLERGTARRLVRGRSSPEMSQVVAVIRDLQFSPDSREIFFSSIAWAQSFAIHGVDVVSGRERFVTPGGEYCVMREGPHAGKLMVVKHKHDPEPGRGSYDAEFIVTFEGKEVERLRVLP